MSAEYIKKTTLFPDRIYTDYHLNAVTTQENSHYITSPVKQMSSVSLQVILIEDLARENNQTLYLKRSKVVLNSVSMVTTYKSLTED